jgi:hypothetical protein
MVVRLLHRYAHDVINNINNNRYSAGWLPSRPACPGTCHEQYSDGWLRMCSSRGCSRMRPGLEASSGRPPTRQETCQWTGQAAAALKVSQRLHTGGKERWMEAAGLLGCSGSARHVP